MDAASSRVEGRGTLGGELIGKDSDDSVSGIGGPEGGFSLVQLEFASENAVVLALQAQQVSFRLRVALWSVP